MLGNSARSQLGAAIARLALDVMHFAPMLCVFFLGFHMITDCRGAKQEPRSTSLMYACTGAVLFQAALAVVAPLAFGAELRPGGPPGMRSANAGGAESPDQEVVMRNS